MFVYDIMNTNLRKIKGMISMDLIKIVSNVQKISEAISSVIRVDVTVVDKDYNRIAGTGRYRNCIG